MGVQLPQCRRISSSTVVRPKNGSLFEAQVHVVYDEVDIILTNEEVPALFGSTKVEVAGQKDSAQH